MHLQVLFFLAVSNFRHSALRIKNVNWYTLLNFPLYFTKNNLSLPVCFPAKFKIHVYTSLYEGADFKYEITNEIFENIDPCHSFMTFSLYIRLLHVLEGSWG